MEAFLNTKNTEDKIIKRYRNRKLYDTQQSCYVTLNDIAKMIHKNEAIRVIDNSNKADITAQTLTQIIFETEKKIAIYPPLPTLREIIQYKTGNLSNFLAKLGLFDEKELASQQAQPKKETLQSHLNTTDPAKEKADENTTSKATAPTILPSFNKNLNENL